MKNKKQKKKIKSYLKKYNKIKLILDIFILNNFINYLIFYFINFLNKLIN